MSHPRWPGWNHKTGNPVEGNLSRRMTLRMYRETKRELRVESSSRKRKKMLKRVEGGNYLLIIMSEMRRMARERGSW